MICPKCQSAETRSDVPALAKANICSHCGWLEITFASVEPNLTTYEKMQPSEMERRPRVYEVAPPFQTCVLCGKNRDELKSAGGRVVLGVSGGICEHCIQLAHEMIQSVTSQDPAP